MLIDLLRHGATDREGYLDGKTDHPLSAEGWAQFKSQTDDRNWSSIVSSPLLRAREAAEALAKARNLALRIDEDLTELDLGVWDGRRIGTGSRACDTRGARCVLPRPPGQPASGRSTVGKI